MSSSSSESDEEEKKKLASVVSGYQASKDENTNKSKKKKSRSHEPCLINGKLKRSMRNPSNDEEPEHIMKTTPEFRSFVSKKLDAFLEKEVVDCETCSEFNGNNEITDAGVRLLLHSKIHLTDALLDEADCSVKKACAGKLSKKRKKYSAAGSDSSSESDEEESKRLRSAAVSADFVLKDTAVSAHKPTVPE